MTSPQTTAPDRSPQQAEVEANYEQFKQDRSELLQSDLGRFALYRGRKIVGTFDTLRDAVVVGHLTGGFPFSVQEITPWVEYVYAAA